jgi:transcriptional regulator with XRE-family HTH domain
MAASAMTPPVAKEEGEHVVTARQLRAGRALLNWSQKQLAEAADVSRATLMRIEADAPDTKASTLKAISDALRKEGVRLYDGSDGIGEGARMAKPDE